MGNRNYSILVNTTDSFEDCWIPFFTLFEIFWPAYEGKIYLNTETKEFVHPRLNIISCKNNISLRKNNSWSDGLRRALDLIEEDILLYLQDDYFFKDRVKGDMIDTFVEMMQLHPDIHCLQLTDQAVLAGNKSEKYDNLYAVAADQKYRISCQAALWRKEILSSCLRSNEDAWQFEEFGSKRESALNHKFYVVDPNWVRLDAYEILPYIFTGIVRKRWNEQVVPLFKKHGIRVDYTKRGFRNDAPQRSLAIKMMDKCAWFLAFTRNYFELRKIKRSKQSGL